MRKIEYHYGEILNQEIGSVFLCEVESNTAHRKAWVLCGSCKRPYVTSIDVVKNRGHLCYDCGRKKGGKNRVRYHDGDVLNKETGSILLKKDKEDSSKGWIRCGRCGRQYHSYISPVVSGCLCDICGYEIASEKNRKYNTGDIICTDNGLRFLFLAELEKKDNCRYGEFVQIDENNNYIGKRFVSRPSIVARGVVNGQGQPNGEKVFEEMLKFYHLSYQKQIKFPDLRGARGGSLSYDFKIILPNQKEILVEIDGEQHYQSIEYFGGEEKLYWQRKNDKIKDDYANLNSYLLLRLKSKDVVHYSFADLYDTVILSSLGGE